MRNPDNIRLASYVRNSEEEANPERQRATINGWLSRHSYTLGQEYHDAGGRRHQLHDQIKRPAWHRLIQDIKSGAWDIVVVDDVTRLGFISHRELVEILGICEDNHVQLWEASTDRQLCDDDITSIILNAVKADRNKSQLQNLARTSLGGRLSQAKMGCYTGGFISYGCALSCQDANHVERWRVETHPGYKLELIHADGRVEWIPAMPRDRRPGEEIYQVLSKYKDRHDIVRRIFTQYTTLTISANAIAMQLNQEGIGSHTRSGKWYGSLIARTLRQPLYTGRWAFGKTTTHRYATVIGGVATNIKGTGKAKRKEAQEWVWTGQLFDGIVDQAIFEAAQARLKPHTVRAPSNPDLWLSGIVFCSRCGGRMSGWHAKDRNPALSYRCDTYVRLGKNNPAGCWPHQVSHTVLLHWIDKYLADTAQVLEDLVGGRSGPDGLLGRFWAQHRDRLTQLRREIEDYLCLALDEILPHQDLPGGRKRYEIDFGDDHIVLDLPGCDDPVGLEMVYDWVHTCRSTDEKAQLALLETEKTRLEGLWLEAPTKNMRDRLKLDLVAVDAEVSRLQHGMIDKGKLLRDIYRSLCKLTAQVKAARKTTGSLQRAKAVRGIIDRIECTFEHRILNGKKAGRLIGVRFVPISGDAVEYYTDDSVDTDEPAPRRSSRACGTRTPMRRSTGWLA